MRMTEDIRILLRFRLSPLFDANPSETSPSGHALPKAIPTKEYFMSSFLSLSLSPSLICTETILSKRYNDKLSESITREKRTYAEDRKRGVGV